MDSEKVYKIAVYGTLKKDSGRKIDYIKGTLYNIGNSYPALRLSEDGDRVEVEIAEITSEELYRWDKYEESPQLFSRKKTVTESGEKVYVYAGRRILEQICEDDKIKPDADGIVRWHGVRVDV